MRPPPKPRIRSKGAIRPVYIPSDLRIPLAEYLKQTDQPFSTYIGSLIRWHFTHGGLTHE